LNNFENTGRRKIGLNSPREFGDVTLGIGIMYAFLKLYGKLFNLMHLLNSFVSVGVKIQLANFTNLDGISSGPCAE